MNARLVPVFASALLAGGCHVLESSVPTPETYRLWPAASAAARADATVPLAITVARPRTSAALDSDRIAVAPAPSRFDHYADVRWAEPAPQMLQQNLVAALESSGRFAGVFAAPARVPAELLLDVELRHFEAVATEAGATPVAHVQLQVSLVDSRRVVRVTSFVSEARVPAAHNRRGAIVAAFERASAQVVADVVERIGRAAAGLEAAPPE